MAVEIGQKRVVDAVAGLWKVAVFGPVRSRRYRGKRPTLGQGAAEQAELHLADVGMPLHSGALEVLHLKAALDHRFGAWEAEGVEPAMGLEEIAEVAAEGVPGLREVPHGGCTDLRGGCGSS